MDKTLQLILIAGYLKEYDSEYLTLISMRNLSGYNKVHIALGTSIRPDVTLIPRIGLVVKRAKPSMLSRYFS